MVIGTKELGGLLFQGEKIKNRENLGGCGLGFRTSYTQNFFFFLISNLH